MLMKFLFLVDKIYFYFDITNEKSVSLSDSNGSCYTEIVKKITGLEFPSHNYNINQVFDCHILYNKNNFQSTEHIEYFKGL